jgi:hypothetical protein
VAITTPLPAVRDGVDHRVGRGRHAGGGHDLLRVRLRALEPRGRRAGPEDRDVETVHETRDQRRLGADHDEVAALRGGDEPVEVRHRHVDELRVARDAGVARRAQQLGLLRRALERPDDRVLASARADDEDPGQARARR